ncbi:hypothetical protein PHLH8_28320 [Pseudomonas sp. Pc102]|uniref:hypothetical protein n=1 Tax=Pseudomonas sp. Pc102 TaxID=2678261 RepID=UPI001BD00A77|nr:hypothetical protein [Pseudomonas sp. Pc102]BBP83190.1 hypothetical protein PHLH8_28320 [Pseudomonas sp. Pc102]
MVLIKAGTGHEGASSSIDSLLTLASLKPSAIAPPQPSLLPRSHARLQALLAACEALSHEAYVDLEGNNFDHPQWAPLRTAAQEALALLLWQELEAHMPALVEDCQAALEKWRS